MTDTDQAAAYLTAKFDRLTKALAEADQDAFMAVFAEFSAEGHAALGAAVFDQLSETDAYRQMRDGGRR